jgi:hypothetical protein
MVSAPGKPFSQDPDEDDRTWLGRFRHPRVSTYHRAVTPPGLLDPQTMPRSSPITPPPDSRRYAGDEALEQRYLQLLGNPEWSLDAGHGIQFRDQLAPTRIVARIVPNNQPQTKSGSEPKHNDDQQQARPRRDSLQQCSHQARPPASKTTTRRPNPGANEPQLEPQFVAGVKPAPLAGDALVNRCANRGSLRAF